MEIDYRSLSEKITAGEKITYRFTFNTGKINEVSNNLALIALAKMQFNFLRDVIITFLKETIINAVKANLKRIYFKKHNVDINDKEKYNELIENFKEEALLLLDEYEPELKKANLFVEISMHLNNDFVIDVMNNIPISPVELERINTRLAKAANYTSMADAFEDVGDETEGAGLGLVLNMMLIKKSGIGTDAFQINSDGETTHASLKVPQKLKTPQNVLDIRKLIINEIDGIPTFPDTIVRVLEMCDDPKSDMKKVSTAIEQDPALAADILKLANSGGFITANKTKTLSSAVTLLGLKVVRQIVVASSSRKLLNENLKVFQGFWDHSFKCAFYAKKIAEKNGMKKSADNIYLGGLLHDLGKMVLYSIQPETIEKINGINIDLNERSSSIMEEISLGVSHTQIGEEIATKWNFDTELREIILNHHCPSTASEEYRKNVSVVHIANALLNAEKNKGRYGFIDPSAAALMKMRTEDDFKKIHDLLIAEYAESQQK